jgi:hypothetical protein
VSGSALAVALSVVAGLAGAVQVLRGPRLLGVALLAVGAAFSLKK